ncbi:MAG: hypothetical protein WCQ21_26855 [Verrucomicrobiota bacterium]
MAGADLVSGPATSGARIKDLIPEAEKGEFGGEAARSAVGSFFVGIQERTVKTTVADVLQMVEGLTVQRAGVFFEWRVKAAKERSGGKHISAYKQIYCVPCKL